jgi:fatty acid desaturase
VSDVHPHDLRAPVPDRIDRDTLKRLSTIDDGRAARAIVTEWLQIGLAVSLALWAAHPVVTALAVVVIGARQHALTVIGHDAVHWRLFSDRRLNDTLGNLIVQWPVFLSVESFRHFHGEHHRFTGMEGDGNRFLWRTHDADGQLTPEWRYPKSRAQLAAKVLRRAFFFTGLRWIVRSFVAAWLFRSSTAQFVARMGLTAALAAALTWLSAWPAFLLLWVLPFCTWHVAAKYLRLIAEHSAIPGSGPYAVTRTTLATPLERYLVVPRNIHYHLEHHWYPSVPWYHLPALHEALMAKPGYREQAVVSPSLRASLATCAQPVAVAVPA